MIEAELGGDGVLVAAIDMPGRTMNVFSPELIDALEALQDHVDATSEVRSVVVTSGKASFLAGADLSMVRGFTERARTDSEEQMFALCGRLGRLFVRLEASRKPWVGAVNGTALGGGLELALACRARVVTDDARALLGTPEVRWGLLPGAGGTQRLPRLVGFDAAMPLLLTGRSIDPARAVALGMFECAVHPDALLSEARALACSFNGRAYDPACKFAHLAQRDVPQPSAEAARRIARERGIADDDFERYPAYGAIIDSVLLGARLPLAEATDVEMRQFLRLMFDPVAGNMVRTLFLNRQRADREWAPPADVRIERVAFGALPAMWMHALSRSKLVHAFDAELPANTIEVTDGSGARHRAFACALADASHGMPVPAAVLSPAGPYGRVLEVVGADDGDAAVLASLASRLQALPYRTAGGRSMLAQLRGLESIDAQALAALRLWAEGSVEDIELFDVAACTACVAPAWSGGPFTRLRQHRERLVDRCDSTTAAASDTLEAALRRYA